MSELFEVTSPLDRRLALGASGLLGAANEAGILTAADVHVATRLGALGGEADERVLLALGLATRGVRLGSVCVDLDAVRDITADSAGDLAAGVAGFAWPDIADWHDAVERSPLVAAGVLRRDLGLLYLDRYHREELAVCADLLARGDRLPPQLDEAALEAALARIFPGEGYAEQRDASRRAAGQWTTVLTGGPGTGKTTTVAGLLAVLAEQAELAGRPLRIALTAPTGKAAARLGEATAEAAAKLPDADRDRLAQLPARTMHRLLGSLPGRRTRFRHHRGNRLPHDVVVVDEMSMVSLTMMARLVEAVRPQARLVLVGDPDQLASVDAGAVLADLVGGLSAHEPSPVVTLTARHRFGTGIGALADAIGRGDPDEVITVLRAGGEGVEFIEISDAAPDPTRGDATEGDAGEADRAFVAAASEAIRPRLLEAALALRDAAAAGEDELALDLLARHRLLCAHRRGPYGVQAWNRLVEQWLSEATGQPLWESGYEGRPLLVTSNDYANGLFNGDIGVIVREPAGPMGVFEGGLRIAPARLGDVDTMHAMTVHKSQGSQADAVTLLVPALGSALLSRELFYTGVTRARRLITVVGTERAVREAVERRVQRATGLRRRLAPP